MKYQKFGNKQFTRPYDVHPAWRGIGCILFLVVPLVSWAAGSLTLDYGLQTGWPIPPDILGNPTLPDWSYELPVISPLAIWFYNQMNIYGIAFFSLLYLIVIGGIVSTVYSMVYRVFGPPRYTAIDEPSPDRQGMKHYKR
jgi:hypothetical protein